MKDFLYRLGQSVGLFPSKPALDKKEQDSDRPSSVNTSSLPAPNPNVTEDLMKSAEQFIQPIKSFYAQNQDVVHVCGAAGLTLGALYHSKVARTGLGIAGILLTYHVGSQKLEKLNELEKKNQQEQNHRQEEGDKQPRKPKP